MKSLLIVTAAWMVMISIILFAPWLIVIVGSLYGLKIEIGKFELSMPGLIKSLKELQGVRENET